MSEFDLIARYFTRPERTNPPAVLLGIGDDCALLAPTSSLQAISSDMLVEGRHFFPHVDPRALGHKTLAVNLSDLAAIGARPVAFTLAVALPDIDSQWLAEFSTGLFALADQFDCALIGGDTTKGPRTICITIFGEVAARSALRRDAAQVDDDIWVSGQLGEARAALAQRRGEIVLDQSACAAAYRRMDWPTPRVALGLQLAGLAHAAIDISDGLVGDLQHILLRSKLGARLLADAVPIGAALCGLPEAVQRDFCLTGGDDYELCFTAAPGDREQVQRAAQTADVVVTRIGQIETTPGLRLYDQCGVRLAPPNTSFDHFAS